MKLPTAHKIHVIILIVCILALLFIFSGCGIKKPVEIYEYKLKHYIYYDYWELQDAIDSFERVEGFHQVVNGVHEIHNMSGDFCNTGHEINHADVYEGRKSLNKHFQ